MIPNDFLIDGGAISARKRGTVTVAKPHPKPIMIRPIIIRARWLERPTMAEPSMIEKEEVRRVLTRPRGLVIELEPSEPTNPPRVKIETTNPN